MTLATIGGSGKGCWSYTWGGLKNEDQGFADLGSGGYSFTMVRALYGGGREHAQRLIAGSFHRVPSQDDFLFRLESRGGSCPG